MFLYFALTFAVAACLFELYLLISYVRCRGKYPPFVISFGRVKRDLLQKAEEVLAGEEESVDVVDLGCGSGSLLVPLAKKFPQHRFYGYEWDALPFFLVKKRTGKLNNLHIYKKDFMKEDLSRYKLLLCNVGNGLEQELGRKLNAEISADAIVLPEMFRLAFLREKEIFPSRLWGLRVNVFWYVRR